jgi:hypothetical protein
MRIHPSKIILLLASPHRQMNDSHRKVEVTRMDGGKIAEREGIRSSTNFKMPKSDG